MKKYTKYSGGDKHVYSKGVLQYLRDFAHFLA